MPPTVPLSVHAHTTRCAFDPCVSPPSGGTEWCYYHRAQLAYGAELSIEPLATVMWLREVAAGYDPGRDEHGCIIWPFPTKSPSGYGQTNRVVNGKLRSYVASRWLCEMVHGNPPTADEWHAAHSCGRGNHGCTTAEHLSWKTPPDNNADKKLHGTQAMGEDHFWATMTDAQVRAIILDPRPPHLVAPEYGIRPQQVSRLKRGDRWRHIYDELVAEGAEIPRGAVGGYRLDGSPARLITEEVARAILASDELPRVLAERYDTSLSNVRAIKKGLTWKHIR